MSLIIIGGGHAGTGKTTCAHIFSNKLGYPILDKATMTDPLATALYKQYGGEADMFSSPPTIRKSWRLSTSVSWIRSRKTWRTR